MLSILFLLHVILGVGAIALGAVALRARKFTVAHRSVGEIYHWVMLLTCVSAVGISYALGRASVFTYLAPPSYALALLGYLMAKYRPANWLRWHITGQAGSYVSLITATMFQFVPRFWHSETKLFGLSLTFWVVLITPGLIANFFIKRTKRKWANAKVPSRVKTSVAVEA